MKISAVILAAGQGTRMRSDLPKVLHPLVGRPMAWHALQAARQVTGSQPVMVIGHGAEAVRQALGEEAASFVVQDPQLGTGHAVMQAEPRLRGASDLVLVTYADMPLVRSETLRQLVAAHQAYPAAVTLMTVMADDPRGFGRILRSASGQVQAIVEEAQATPEQLAIRELNASVYCFSAEWLWPALGRIPLSPKGEYYLTDLIAMAVEQGKKLDAFILQDPTEGLGINTRVDLADCELAMRRRVIQQWMLDGVTFLDPESCTIESDVVIGQDTVILPNTHLRGSTRIGENCQIGPDTTLSDTTVGNDCMITYSVTEKASLGNHVSMGPFCHLRKGAVLMDGVHLGNFGEVKDSVLDECVKMGHFSYIGNAKIGKNVNIGAGTITCNFDGKFKHPTEIGENTFIGSDTMLVAPLKIGKNAKTGAGAVVTKDVPDGTLVYGVPARPKERKE